MSGRAVMLFATIDRDTGWKGTRPEKRTGWLVGWPHHINSLTQLGETYLNVKSSPSACLTIFGSLWLYFVVGGGFLPIFISHCKHYKLRRRLTSSCLVQSFSNVVLLCISPAAIYVVHQNQKGAAE